MKRKAAFVSVLLAASVGATAIAGCGKRETGGTSSALSGQSGEMVQTTGTSMSVSGSSVTSSKGQPVSKIVDGKDNRPRVILTTDMECDDQDSLIHMALFFNDLDIDGIIYSASQFHFNGDGEHTLEEINPDFNCEGLNGDSREEIGKYTSFRAMPEDWIENLWKNEYASVYESLSSNDPDYPTPEYLESITKKGNIAFEGDVREDTEGSDWIKNAILDDDDRKLYLLTWGGFNTTARALLSIYDDYKDDEAKWNEIRDKIYNKVVICGYSQDTTYKNYIYDLYPDMKLLEGSDGYAGYFAAVNAQPDVRYTFKADWLKKNIKFDHGALLESYHLMGDGTHYENEPDNMQYGETTTIDWGFMKADFDKYDFLGEGDSGTFTTLIPVGLRGLEGVEKGYGSAGSYGGKLSYTEPNLKSFAEQISEAAPDPTDYNWVTGQASDNTGSYLLDYQNEWAARADWCVKKYEEANHAPSVSLTQEDFEVAAGESVELSAEISDPDGDETSVLWMTDPYTDNYSGNSQNLRVWNPTAAETSFTVPADAKEGDMFIITATVRDDAEKQMTRYAQAIVRVTAPAPASGETPTAP